MYQWFQQQCLGVETKSEFDRSCELLDDFLDKHLTVHDLGSKCIATIRKLQASIRVKEHKLANYIRMDIKSCNEAATTSPVESANSRIKHGPNKIHANMNLDRSSQIILDGITTRLDKRRKPAHREMNANNAASNSHMLL